MIRGLHSHHYTQRFNVDQDARTTGDQTHKIAASRPGVAMAILETKMEIYRYLWVAVSCVRGARRPSDSGSQKTGLFELQLPLRDSCINMAARAVCQIARRSWRLACRHPRKTGETPRVLADRRFVLGGEESERF